MLIWLNALLGLRIFVLLLAVSIRSCRANANDPWTFCRICILEWIWWTHSLSSFFLPLLFPSSSPPVFPVFPPSSSSSPPPVVFCFVVLLFSLFWWLFSGFPGLCLCSLPVYRMVRLLPFMGLYLACAGFFGSALYRATAPSVISRWHPLMGMVSSIDPALVAILQMWRCVTLTGHRRGKVKKKVQYWEF